MDRDFVGLFVRCTYPTAFVPLISLTSYSPRKKKKKSLLSAIVSLSLLFKKNVDVSGNVFDAMRP